jgi:HEAT repeat protein
MQQFFRKAFRIYPGEGKNTLSFVRLSIFWAFATTCMETLADGLFLEKVGTAMLPHVYLFTAIGMIVVSSVVVYSLRIVSPYRILTSVLAIGALLCLIVIFTLSHSPPHWFWLGLKIYSRMFFSVFLACAWTFIDQYHDLQDAKRVYSLYSSAYFLGIVCSGTLISLFLNQLGHTVFFAMAFVSILLAFAETRKIVHKIPAIHDDTLEGVFSGDRSGFSSMLEKIFKSPFTLCLLGLSLFIQFLLTVTEFNYLETFGKTFQSGAAASDLNANTVSEFLGKCRAWVSVGNILFGAFCFSPFVRRVGLNNAVLVTPIFFLIVYFGWVIHDSLLIAILGLIAVEGILFTIEDNSFNLLTKAVPAKLKSKVRIISDSFFEPVGMLISSSLLFMLHAQSRWLGLIFSAILLVLCFMLRSIYSKAVFINLKENAIHFDRKTKHWFQLLNKRDQKEMKKDIVEALQNRDESIKLASYEALIAIADSSAVDKILPTVSSLSLQGKISLMKTLDTSPFANDPRVIELIDDWKEYSDHPQLAKLASFYLAKRGLLHPEKVEDDLESLDLLVRAAAIITLKKSLAGQNLSNVALNRTIALKEIELLLKSADTQEICMGLEILGEVTGPEFAEKVLPFLSNEETEVKRASAKTLARLSDKTISRHAPKIIEELQESSDNTFRLSCLQALGKIADSTTVRDIVLSSVHFRPSERRITEKIIVKMGLKTVPTLLSMVRDTGLHDRCRILAGKILAKLALPQLQANLSEIIGIEMERAYFYFYYGNTIQKEHPAHDLSMLENALITGFQSVIDFIIHLLGAAGSIEDCELLVMALHSKNPKVHSNAIETLEKACDMRIFKYLSPLIDDIPPQEKMAACLEWKEKNPHLGLSELLEKLERSPSLFDKIVAVSLKAKLELPNWRKSLREQIKTCDETFHHFAYELLET